MSAQGSTLELGDSVHDALLTRDERDPALVYEQETQAALRRKEQQIDAKSHRKKLLGWLSYAFARHVTDPCIAGFNFTYHCTAPPPSD